MSEEQLNAFQEAVKADADLQVKLKAASDLDEVVAIAKTAGFVFSSEEIEAAAAAARSASEDLSDEELESVTGGAGNNDFIKQVTQQPTTAAFEEALRFALG